MHIHSCVYLQETSGSKHTPFTHRASCASHHCSTPDFPRPEVPQEERNSWIERLSNLRRAMACFPLLSSREREIFALEHKAILRRELSHPGRKQMTPGKIWIKSLQSNLLSQTSKACLLFTHKAQTVQKYENVHATLFLSITMSLWSFHFHFPNAPKWKNKLIYVIFLFHDSLFFRYSNWF